MASNNIQEAILSTFGQCFSSLRRVQFTNEQRINLLDEMGTESPAPGSISEQVVSSRLNEEERRNAALELRRRMNRMDIYTGKKTSDEIENDFGKLETTSDDEFDMNQLSIRVENPEDEEIYAKKKKKFTNEAKKLRKWLANIDINKKEEYIVFATNFEKEGLNSIEKISQIKMEEVDDILTAIGVMKFLPRHKMRKAILSLSN